MLISVYVFPHLFKKFMEQASDKHPSSFTDRGKHGDLFPLTVLENAAQGTSAFMQDLQEGACGNRLKIKNVWGFMDDPKTVRMSSVMFKELVVPYCKGIEDEFGLLSSGCYEPGRLRKHSLSPCCDKTKRSEHCSGKKNIRQTDFLSSGKES